MTRGGAAKRREEPKEAQALNSGVLHRHPPPLLLDSDARDTSTEEDVEGMQEGEIKNLGMEAAEDVEGKAVEDGEAAISYSDLIFYLYC